MVDVAGKCTASTILVKLDRAPAVDRWIERPGRCRRRCSRRWASGWVASSPPSTLRVAVPSCC